MRKNTFVKRFEHIKVAVKIYFCTTYIKVANMGNFYINVHMFAFK